ncbi:hypothetical protein N9L68_02285 [bacterium]|nr:hypothetical protein [bacterium]
MKRLAGGQLRSTQPQSEYDEIGSGQPLSASRLQVKARECGQPLRQQPQSELDKLLQSLDFLCSQAKALEGGQLKREQLQSELVNTVTPLDAFSTQVMAL